MTLTIARGITVSRMSCNKLQPSPIMTSLLMNNWMIREGSSLTRRRLVVSNITTYRLEQLLLVTVELLDNQARGFTLKNEEKFKDQDPPKDIVQSLDPFS